MELDYASQSHPISYEHERISSACSVRELQREPDFMKPEALTGKRLRMLGKLFPMVGQAQLLRVLLVLSERDLLSKEDSTLGALCTVDITLNFLLILSLNLCFFK